MTEFEELAALISEFARTMATDFPVQGILDQLVQRMVGVMPAAAAGVTLVTPAGMATTGNRVRRIAATQVSALALERLQGELVLGPGSAAYESGQFVAVPDLAADQQFTEFAVRALDAGHAAAFAFPLRRGKVQLGALTVYLASPGQLSPESVIVAQTLIDVAAAYLINAQVRVELQESLDRSSQAALHDALTGLPNRVLLLDHLEHAALRSRRSGKSAAILFVDLDHFKAINDTHGHRVGDEFLVAVAQRLSGQLRPHDTVARLAGDEFVILCEDLDSPAQADAIATRLLGALNRPFVLSRAEVLVTASIGIAVIDSGEVAFEHLLNDADTAMYQAKREGGGRYQRFLPIQRDPARPPREGLSHDLPGALRRGELFIEYQPIVSTVDGRVTGFEAFLRWAHPRRGILPPGTVIIPLAVQGGLISDIGNWVLQQAWTDRQQWAVAKRRPDLGMAVNISAHQLMAPGFAATVDRLLRSGSGPAHLLTLEITESVIVQDSERALLVLGELKTLGVRLALDNFGTGYSSLIYLRRFPIDIVKIDRQLVAELGTDPVPDAIVAAVVQLAHSLGMTVIAEGVETVAQQRQIALLDCDSGQGFYFARPMTAANVDALLDKQPRDAKISDAGDHLLDDHPEQ